MLVVWSELAGAPMQRKTERRSSEPARGRSLRLGERRAGHFQHKETHENDPVLPVPHDRQWCDGRAMVEPGPRHHRSAEGLVVKSASFDDRCSGCGKVMLDTEGSLDPVPYAVCDSCLFERSRQHSSRSGPQDRVLPLPKPIKELSTMKSYVTNFISGLFGRFRRLPSGELECLGLAQENDGAQIVKMMTESEKENTPLKVASTFVRHGQRISATDLDAETRAATLDSDPEYRAALEAGDSEVLARIAAA